MGAVKPPEVGETASHLLTRSLGNDVSTDFPMLPSNGKMKTGKENTRKLNGVLDVEDGDTLPQQLCCTTDELAIPVELQEGCSSHCDDEVVPESSDHGYEEKTQAAAPTPINPETGKVLNGETTGEPTQLSNGDTGWSLEGVAQNPGLLWTPADEPNAGWEIAEDQSVLGPGPTANDENKGAELKPVVSKELHTFYMIRIPKPADSELRTQIKMADVLFKEKTDKRDLVSAGFRLKKMNRQEALDKLRAAKDRVRECVDSTKSKVGEMEPLQSALRKLRDAGRMAKDKSRDLPASEQELDERIAYFEYRIQHESIPLREEKQLLRDIKNLKGRREEVCANEALQAEFSESLGERDDIQERLKPLVAELESLKSQWTVLTEKSKLAEVEFKKMDEALKLVQSQLTAANQARQDAFEARALLYKEENARNNEFYKNKWEIQHVRQLAFKKDKKAVEDICNAQVERVMNLWNNDDAYRTAYVKANEKSTLKRLQTFDGRALGPDEEPPVLSSEPDDVDTRIKTGDSNLHATSQREDQIVKVKPPEQNHVAVHSTSAVQKKERDLPSTPVVDGDGHSTSIKTEEDSVKEDPTVAAELKEKRRQQEMTKAKEAERRKNKLAEKAQIKALARAKKDAERREKEKEKKARKKAASLAQSNENIIPSTDVDEIEEQLGTDPQLGADSHSKVHVDVASESKPSSANRRKLISHKSKTAVKPPLARSLPKKDGIFQQTWIWIALGLLIFLGLLGLVIKLVFNSS